MDVTTAQAHLDKWLAADLAVATGQSYSIGSRTLTRVDSGLIRGSIIYWQREVNAATALALGSSNPNVLKVKFV